MMRAPSLPQFAAAALAMAAVVLASNILVQFPLNDWLTWGAITYPVAFLVSELVNRAHGPQQARRVAWVGFAVAVAASLVLAPVRIAIASGTAFLLSQWLDISVFDRLRHAHVGHLRFRIFNKFNPDMKPYLPNVTDDRIFLL